MSDNPQGTGSISLNDAVSLLNTPIPDKVEEERPEEQEAPQPMEAEAEVTEEDTQLEAESYEDDEDDAYDVEESEEEDDYEDGEEEPQETVYTVKVDGEEIEVSLDKPYKVISDNRLLQSVVRKPPKCGKLLRKKQPKQSKQETTTHSNLMCWHSRFNRQFLRNLIGSH